MMSRLEITAVRNPAALLLRHAANCAGSFCRRVLCPRCMGSGWCRVLRRPGDPRPRSWACGIGLACCGRSRVLRALGNFTIAGADMAIRPKLPLLVPSLAVDVADKTALRLTYIPKIEKARAHALHLSVERRF